jgi:hypothetical protein
MTTQEQIESFYRFATEQLANGDADKSVDDLYDQWRYETELSENMAENVAAVQASIDDMNNGETGRDVCDVIGEMREKFNLPMQ